MLSENAYMIPDYQRSYAWEVRQRQESRDHQINDFWEDSLLSFQNHKRIKANGDTPAQYYWGTLTVKEESVPRKVGYKEIAQFSIVDGQQRIITLVLLIFAFHLSTKDKSLYDDYLVIDGYPRLKAGSVNEDTINDVLMKSPNVRGLDLKSNKRIMAALAFFQKKVDVLDQTSRSELIDYLLNSTIALHFDTADDRLATQAFLGLNDRGKPLTNLQKLKGVLVGLDCYYIHSFSSYIDRIFGAIYKAMDHVNAIGESTFQTYFRDVTDDNFIVLAYHYFAPDAIARYGLSIPHDARASAAGALEFFRVSAMTMPSKGTDMGRFVKDLLADLESVAKALDGMANLSNAGSNTDLYRVFGFLNVNPHLVPILVSAHIHNYLTPELIQEVENVDLRVFKMGGLSRIAPLYNSVMPHFRDASDANVVKALKSYWGYWAPDHFFQSYVATLHNKEGHKYILWRFQKTIDPHFNLLDLSLYGNVTIEHIFAQIPRITIPGSGFSFPSDYEATVNLVGNLSLLEHYGKQNLQKAADNLAPIDKAKGAYLQSVIPDIFALSSSVPAVGFTKNNVDTRTASIQLFCLNTWR